jgi:hypothetical protein
MILLNNESTICTNCKFQNLGFLGYYCTATAEFKVKNIITGIGKTVGIVKCKKRNNGNCEYFRGNHRYNSNIMHNIKLTSPLVRPK